MENNATNAHEFSVSQISGAIKNIIEDEFGYVRVRGEVGRLSRPNSGHLYFDLKDEKASISAVAWKGVASKWRFQPEQGLEVIVTGRITTFAGQSKYQIIVESVEPAGIGALMALLEERRKKLLEEGLFDEGHKKPLPYLPKNIGVITSPSGAVIRDILHRLSDRFPTNVIIWPVRVQGESCASEVTTAINGFNALDENSKITKPDLIIVARGGGSVEDLWGFNEEEVVRAVFESKIPIISAIGHETDTTLIDYVADIRAPTPTAAAEIAVPVRAELVVFVEDLGSRVKSSAFRLLVNQKERLRAISFGLPKRNDLLSFSRQRLDLAIERLNGALRQTKQQKSLALAQIAPRLSLSAIKQRNEDLGKTLNILSTRMLPAINRLIFDRKKSVLSFAKLLNTLSYNSILERGFALVSDKKGKLISKAINIKKGDLLNIQFADGKINAIAKSDKSPSIKQKKTLETKDDGQTNLF
ncbi:MAG: exodeoxyribonuclease VII large subunit [Devosiaceae bacterium]|nr:exodeoxyribonuclease VII large subunit [Devosiaceae bacterium]